MFQPNIVSLCDEEQQIQWLPKCRDWSMIGCYAQTELGHGSNIRALETTATFVPESKGGEKGGSFVVNSPTLTSGKFWPGTLGRTANHAMVIARLIDGDGIDRGIHNFLVQLRSTKDHKLLPGVKTGDIGPKIGYNTMDNGYAYFDNVVIPRRNMAMRFSSVDEHGKYTKKYVSDASSKVAYITMMQVRSMIVNGASKALGAACTITIRYSAVRKQGFAENGKSEKQILDYTQQQHRIFPLLAASYCIFFTGREIAKNLKEIENKLITSKPVLKEDVADVHATSSALKSFSTIIAADGIEECRKACGGHGYLACSGLPELFTTYLQNPTVEGDNHMLPQQVIRVLLKVVQAIRSNKNVEKFKLCSSYDLVPSLRIILQGGKEKCVATDPDEFCELPSLLVAFRHRAARCLVEVSKGIHCDVSRNRLSPESAWNKALVSMSKASKSYSIFMLIRNALNGIESEKRRGAIGRDEVAVLTDLTTLFALYWMEKDLGDFLVDEYLSHDQFCWISPLVLKYLSVVRRNSVPLCDAFDISDFRLKSALGKYDGWVYDKIIAAAKNDPLNSVDPGPAYEPELKRLITGGAGVYANTASRL